MTDEIRVSENSQGEVVIPNPFDNVIEEKEFDENGNLVGINRKYPDCPVVVVENEGE